MLIDKNDPTHNPELAKIYELQPSLEEPNLNAEIQKRVQLYTIVDKKDHVCFPELNSVWSATVKDRIQALDTYFEKFHTSHKLIAFVDGFGLIPASKFYGKNYFLQLTSGLGNNPSVLDEVSTESLIK